MKKLLVLFAAAGILTVSCRKIEVDNSTGDSNNGGGGSEENTVLQGYIKESRTLKANYTYVLKGLVYVTDGAVLTIEAGTKIVGDMSTTQKAGLIITRGSKIYAEGNAEKPIVFTSASSTPHRGDWAGLVILGNAPTNASFNGTQGVGEVEGGINNSDGLGLYGGTNPADNSGILKYVRVEYAGYAFLPDKEINGITFGGVGNQTIVDYIEVAYANDDSFEWFGGTVNCNHLISYKTLDDDFDTDNGYSGKVQFGIIVRDSSIADISKVESFESDNDANGSALYPRTSAVFSNITSIGPRQTTLNLGNTNFLAGAQIRRNSKISIFNSIFLGWPTGVLIDASKGVPTDLNITADSLFIQNTIIAGSATPVKYSASTTAPTGATNATINDWFNTPAYGNKILNTNPEVGLIDPFNYGSTPDFNPTAGAEAATGAVFTHSKLSGFSNVNYKGACSIGDTWWKGWTKF